MFFQEKVDFPFAKPKDSREQAFNQGQVLS